MVTVKQWERWKDIAEIFLKDNKKVFIKDNNDNIYFAWILLVGEDSLRIQCFNPPKRLGDKITLYYPLIVRMEEYVERGESK